MTALLTITHTAAEGTMIEGTKKGDGTAEILRASPMNWRWSRNLGSWYVRNSKDRPPMRGAIDRFRGCSAVTSGPYLDIALLCRSPVLSAVHTPQQGVTMTSTEEPRKGLIASILSPAGANYSANGISARYPGVVIVGIRARDRHPNVAVLHAVQAGKLTLPRIFLGNDDHAEVELVVRWLNGGVYIHAEPVEGAGRTPMHGGGYIETSDSRFNEMLRAMYDDKHWQVGPVPLHDRYEG